MHGEGQVGLALRRQDPGRGKPLIVDEDGIRLSRPPDAVRGIGHDGVERLKVPMPGVGEGVAELNVELVEPHAVQP